MSLSAKIVYPYQTDYTPNFYHTIRMNCNYVVDGLKEKVDSWDNRNPILIDAPTGSGKNTFIREVCIPHALQSGKNILIVSNRIALSTQQKKMIMKDIDSPLIETLTEKGIQKQEDFGNVRIVTYHRLKAFADAGENAEWISRLKYVIMDEVHFFTSDCLFNEFCGGILNMIPRKFWQAVRIYMTATSSEVLYPLKEAEKEKYHQLDWKMGVYYGPRQIIRYFFPRNFENYKVNFVKDSDKLFEQISNTVNEKWLVFVNSKKTGKELEEKLGNKADYIDADNKNTEAWKAVVNNEKFDKQVLITTSVLDCGVNISDPQLKNIAVMTDNEVSFLQMIGRKRTQSNEKINIWVLDIDKDTAEKRYVKYKELSDWCYKFDCCKNTGCLNEFLSKIWTAEDLRLRKLFGVKNGTVFKNELADLTITRREEFYRKICDGETTFRREVCKWLHKEDVLMNKYEKLFKFCDDYSDKELEDEECAALRKLILEACEEKSIKEAQPKRMDSLGIQALNNRLELLEVAYKIQSVNSKWIITNTEVNR